MEGTTNTRKKAQEIETKILCELARKGHSNVAKEIGVHPAQISRMKEPHGLIARASLLLAALDIDGLDKMVIFSGDEAKRLADVIDTVLRADNRLEQGANNPQ